MASEWKFICIQGKSIFYEALFNKGIITLEDLMTEQKVFLPNLELKFVVIELPVKFLSFGCLYLGILGFKSEQNICKHDL